MTKNKEETKSIRIVEDSDEILASSKRYALEEYSKKVGAFLQEQEEKFQEERSELKEKIKQLPPYEQESYEDFFLEEYYQYVIEFPRILRNSLLVTVVSLLEYELSIICRKLKEQQDIPISCKELKGDSFEQAKSYCKIAGFDLTKDNDRWRDIQKIYLVRNCIVHNNGYVKGSKKEEELIEYVGKEGILSSDEDKELDLTQQYCEKAIKITEDFTNSIWHRIYKLRPRKARGV